MSRFLLSANVYFSLCLNLFLLMQLYTMELCHYFPPNISVVDGQCHNLIQRVCHRSILHHVHSWQCGIVLMFCIFNSFNDDLCPDILLKRSSKNYTGIFPSHTFDSSKFFWLFPLIFCFHSINLYFHSPHLQLPKYAALPQFLCTADKSVNLFTQIHLLSINLL